MLLGQVLVDRNIACDEILLMFDDLQLKMKGMGSQLQHIDSHLGLPPDPSYSPRSNKEPIVV